MDLKNDLMEKWGTYLHDEISNRTTMLFNFAQNIDDKIHNSLDEICVNGQPQSLYVDPVRYLICSYTVEHWLRIVEQRALKPMFEKIGRTSKYLDNILQSNPEDFTVFGHALY